jgi:transposase
MTKPYSEDLRTRVVAAVVADAAQRFSIGLSSVVWWAQRFRLDRERRGQADGREAQLASQR